MKRRSDEEISAPLYEYDAATVRSTVFLPVWTKRAAARCAVRSLWRPVSLTRRSQCTASTTPRS